MKALLILLMIVAVGGVSRAQCGATSVTPTPDIMLLCEGSDTLITFAVTGTCSGTYEYQVLNGATVVQAWSPTASYLAAPIVMTTFTVQARCSACPATVVSQDFIIEVSEEPVLTGDLFVCSGQTADLLATTDTTAVTWWDAETGGTQLSATNTLTTPALTSNTSFWAQASTTSSGTTGGSVLITECGTEGYAGDPSADYIEISNLYSTAINTTGWVVAISDSYTNINVVNSTYWYLPATFAPCSVVTKVDIASAPNYFGTNIFWNAPNNSWAIIIDNFGNVVDFICWGWTAAQIATFNPTINGFNITLGPEWTGNGCPLNCGTVSGIQYSYSRTGNADNNNAADFICQATSTDAVNPGLTCGWSASGTCPYEVMVVVDTPPTASNPANSTYQCSADVPAPDPSVVTTELDDYTSVPNVTFINEVSDGNTCPETITRTYRVADSCTNYIDVTHTIIINDTIAPQFEPTPPDVSVQCIGDVPPMVNLNWTDNCTISGSVAGTDVSSGTSCPEIITRTWTYTDDCGNNVTTSQTITVNDTIPPMADNLNDEQHLVLPPVDINVVTGVSDNCSTPTVTHFSDVSDGGFCPEIVTRTYRITDDCGNEIYRSQNFMVGDPFPEAGFTASVTEMNNLETDVDFFNTTTGAVTYVWNYGDNSPEDSTFHTSHTFPDEEGNAYLVEMIAFSPFGCSDTATIIVRVLEEIIYYVPNSFTPDGDEFNQTFQPVFYSGIDVNNFEMKIYNRWGELLFETHDVNSGWDGTYNGKLVQEGSYVWSLKFKALYNDKKVEDKGHISIIR